MKEEAMSQGKQAASRKGKKIASFERLQRDAALTTP
jgi:hypothetical protein